MYDDDDCVEESQFEKVWRTMLTKYNGEDNKLFKSIYNSKEK